MDRQYLGARYVPKIYSGSNGSSWDGSSVPYESLTIVTYLGNSYTSRKPVPVGIDISNEEYWVCTGNYNAQVEEYREEVAQISDVVNGDRYIVITDSYGSTYANTEGDEHTLYDYLRDALGRTADNLIAQSYGGCGFVKTYQGKNFLSNFTDYSSAVSQSFRNTVTKIIVAAGRNDYESSIDAVLSAIGSFVTYCKANYPNATVYCMYIANGNGIWNGTKAQLKNVFYAFNQCMKVGAIYISGGEAILKRTELMASDGIHPNSDGKKYLGYYMAEGIVTGNCCVNYADVTTPLADHNKWQYVDLPTIALKSKMANNCITLELPRLTSIHFNTAFTPDTSTNLILGGYTANKNFYVFEDDITLPCRLDFKDVSGNPLPKVSGALYLDTSDDLHIRIYENPSASQISDVIVMSDGCVTIPTSLA